MKSLRINFEDMALTEAPTEAEIVEAEQVLDTIPEEVEVQTQEAAAEVIQTTEAGETLLGVADSLDTFAQQADRVLEVGIVGPEHIQQHVEGVNEALATIGDSLQTVSTESVGSLRVSFESANTATRSKIQEIIEFARKAFQLLWTKLKEMWKLFTDSNKRLQAKATKVAEESGRIYKALYRKTAPADKDQQFSANMTFLQYGGIKSTNVLTGLKETNKTIKTFLAEIEFQAKEYHDELKHRVGFIKSGTALPTPHASDWASGNLSGDVQITLEHGSLYPVFRVARPKANPAVVETPIPDDLFAIAVEAREMARALGKCNALQDTLSKLSLEQEKIAQDLAKFAIENPDKVPMSEVRKVADMANKQFAGDLVRAERYFTTVVEHALSYVVKGLRAY